VYTISLFAIQPSKVIVQIPGSWKNYAEASGKLNIKSFITVTILQDVILQVRR
jgi:hypothetical protein